MLVYPQKISILWISMESPVPKFNDGHNNKKEGALDDEKERIIVEPRFEQIRDDLVAMFNIEVTSEVSLRYEWVKDELYAKAVEGLMYDEYFALDYMASEKLQDEEPLLTQEDFIKRGIRSLQDHAATILHMYKEPRLTRIKELFIKSGIMTEEEINSAARGH